MITYLLLQAPLHAAEAGTLLQAPVPLSADPSPFQVTAFALPPQSPDAA